MLRTQRKRARVSVLAATRATGIEISTLKHIESGRTTPDATVLAALLDCYHVTAAEFVPPRAPLETTTSEAPSDEVLRGYVDSVRTWRESGRKDKLNFRANDLLTLGHALSTDPDEIERRLTAITGCSPAEARQLRKWLLAALVTIPVASGAIGGVFPNAAAAAPPSARTASATTIVQGTLRPGSLTLKVADPEFGAVRADGSVPLTVRYVVTDARGSGAGWNLQASFTSTDEVAYPTLETLHNLDDQASLPQTQALPASLSGTPAEIARAVPGTEGMGSFAGQLELSIIGHSAHSSGQLTLTFAPPA
jgi:transcriptional regulator with XRE-family HTH domain